MNPENATLTLRDIHLPDGISWWPPAPGWWIVLVVLLLLLALGIFLYRRRQGQGVHRAALQELSGIQQAYAQHADDQQLVKALSVWLRRVSLSLYPRVNVAGLTGEAWLEFLDRDLARGKDPIRFSEGAGRALISAPYQAVARVDADELLSICRHWLKALPRYPQVRP